MPRVGSSRLEKTFKIVKLRISAQEAGVSAFSALRVSALPGHYHKIKDPTLILYGW